MSWRTFLRAHADVIAGADFFTTEVWTSKDLVTHYVLFVVHHATRAVHIDGITTNPDSAFMAQVARNLTDGTRREPAQCLPHPKRRRPTFRIPRAPRMPLTEDTRHTSA